MDMKLFLLVSMAFVDSNCSIIIEVYSIRMEGNHMQKVRDHSSTVFLIAFFPPIKGETSQYRGVDLEINKQIKLWHLSELFFLVKL